MIRLIMTVSLCLHGRREPSQFRVSRLGLVQDLRHETFPHFFRMGLAVSEPADNHISDSESSSERYATSECAQRAFERLHSLSSIGQYLVRIEHIALHSASSFGGAQLYIACGQINVCSSIVLCV